VLLGRGMFDQWICFVVVLVALAAGTNAVAVSQRNKTELVDQEKQAWNEKKAKSRRTYVR
jgi:uncharacterized membrane protein